MQVGIFARTFARSTLDDVFAAVRGHGIAMVQFNLSCAGLESLPNAISREVARWIRDRAAAHGITLAAVSGTFNAIHPDPAARADGTRRCQQLIRAAPDMGVPLVTLCTGTRDQSDMWKEHPENRSEAAWSDLLKTLEHLVPLAEQIGVDLGIEPESSNVVDSACAARRLLDELQTTRIRIVFDAANLFSTRADETRMAEILRQAVDLLSERIAIVHAKDITDFDKKRQAAGTGRLNWTLYFDLLFRSGFDGPVILHNLEESVVSRSARFIREHVARAEQEGRPS